MSARPFRPEPLSVASGPRSDAIPRGAVVLPFERSPALDDAPTPPSAGEASPIACADRPRIEAALARILESPCFGRSHRHRLFLRYLVEATLDGRARNLKEVVIGLDVFDRSLDGYDPQRDSIVRVEARRLRRKLEQYYAGDGADETIEIVLPVGRYVPRFETRSARGRTRRLPLMLVLPFTTPSGVADAAALSSALADQLVDRLGAHGALQVVAPYAATRHREGGLSLDTLRKTHGIDYVVDGSIACHGSRIRCVAHLSRTADRLRLWSALFDFDASDDTARDVFAFQDRIAEGLFAAVAAERREKPGAC